MSHDSYQSPLSGRYPSTEMKRIWSDDKKFTTWRVLWIRLARAQLQLGGVPITYEQINEMEAHIEPIDYARAAELERRFKHDVVAHIHLFGEVAPAAQPIIHLGATSYYVTDNTDLILMKESLQLLCVGLARVIARLQSFAFEYRMLPTLGLSHYQPAQPTTVGKRTTIWLQDLIIDLEDLQHRLADLVFLGVKGTVGTQESFLKLFQGDQGKVKSLDELVTKACGFSKSVPVSGQTYTRKLDTRIIQALADFGATAHKIGLDMRLLQSRKEIEEPFGTEQVGSSAMAYKRNPMLMERLCSLSRELMIDSLKPLLTHSLQGFERTLDDSACRRRYLAESFLLADSLVLILQKVFQGVVVYPAVIERHLREELPFMATEELLMAMVNAGTGRQECHERIRQHAQAAQDGMKQQGLDNDLLKRLSEDSYFEPIHARLNLLLDPIQFVGRAAEQVEEFMPQCIHAIERYRGQLEGEVDLTV